MKGLSRDNNHSGVWGDHPDSGYGVKGSSNTGSGVYGSCKTSNDIDSDIASLTCVGVWGDGPIGVRGTGNPGVVGFSETGIGLYAVGQTTCVFIDGGSSQNLIVGLGPQPPPTDGIGTSSSDPAALEPQVFRVDCNGALFANGGLNSSGADVAEHIQSCDLLLPGDVVEIDPDRPGSFRVAATANSTRVAGIISTRPGLALNNHGTGAVSDDRPQLALVGQVPVRVSAENGEIRSGDLLVSSSTRGHAMRAPRRPRPGTVVAKALGAMNVGTDTILALVMLR